MLLTVRSHQARQAKAIHWKWTAIRHKARRETSELGRANNATESDKMPPNRTLRVASFARPNSQDAGSPPVGRTKHATRRCPVSRSRKDKLGLSFAARRGDERRGRPLRAVLPAVPTTYRPTCRDQGPARETTGGKIEDGRMLILADETSKRAGGWSSRCCLTSRRLATETEDGELCCSQLRAATWWVNWISRSFTQSLHRGI